MNILHKSKKKLFLIIRNMFDKLGSICNVKRPINYRVKRVCTVSKKIRNGCVFSVNLK